MFVSIFSNTVFSAFMVMGRLVSMLLGILTVPLLAITREVYATSAAFLLLVIKAMLFF